MDHSVNSFVTMLLSNNILYFLLHLSKHSRINALLDPHELIVVDSLDHIGNVPKVVSGDMRTRMASSGFDVSVLVLPFHLGIADVDIYLTQLINKYGYNVEEHHVETSDGYQLTMFRIPGDGPVVFLMHGLLLSAADWVTPGPINGLAYLFADEGFDVWLGNARGNNHSRRHARLSPDSAHFWDFSWDEIGRFDLPAMLDHALATAGRPRLSYVGHLQGTTAFFVLCSERPEYNDKFYLMVALSAVTWMSHAKSPLVKLVSPFNPYLKIMIKLFGNHEFMPNNYLVTHLISKMCGNDLVADMFCGNIIFLLSGFDYAQTNMTNLPVIYGHMPAGASTKQLVHMDFIWAKDVKKNIN